MGQMDEYLDQQLARGRAFAAKGELRAALGLSPEALASTLGRQVRKGRLLVPKHGFYLILRPEDRAFGAPDPARWIDPLMRHLRCDYRVALLRAAAFHGSSHQAAMVFQVIVPRQLRALELGRQRLHFVYQAPASFRRVNGQPWLAQIKTDAGYAKVSGVELTLLDCARYFHKVGGINALAQVAKDLGGKADPSVLGEIAGHYENSGVRRLGYLLERVGHLQAADSLRPFVRKARTAALLDPAVKPVASELPGMHERVPAWRLVVNEAVDVDS